MQNIKKNIFNLYNSIFIDYHLDIAIAKENVTELVNLVKKKKLSCYCCLKICN